MDSLQIRTGQVSLNILDDQGNSRGIFKFNPTDVKSAKRIYALQNEIAQKDAELQQKIKDVEDGDVNSQINVLTETVDYFKGVVDECFGEGSSDLLFGNNNSLAMFYDFFEGIMPYYEKASKQRMDKYLKSGK